MEHLLNIISSKDQLESLLYLEGYDPKLSDKMLQNSKDPMWDQLTKLLCQNQNILQQSQSLMKICVNK